MPPILTCGRPRPSAVATPASAAVQQQQQQRRQQQQEQKQQQQQQQQQYQYQQQQQLQVLQHLLLSICHPKGANIDLLAGASHVTQQQSAFPPRQGHT